MTSKREYTFFDAVIGLTTEPSFVTENLLSEERPPYTLRLISLLGISVLLPLAIFMQRYGVLITKMDLMISITMVALLVILIFGLIELLFLHAVGVDVSISQVLAITAYAVTPFNLFIWLMYLFNYLTSKSLSVFMLIVFGYNGLDDRFLFILPLAIIIAELNVLLVFMYGLRKLGSMHTITATTLTFLSLFPFALSVLIALLIGEIIRPGTYDVMSRVSLPAGDWIFTKLIEFKVYFQTLISRG